jgi:Ca2+-transporting ATPase
MPTENPSTTQPPSPLWHLRDGMELAREQGVDPEHGLPADEVAQRAQQHGPNALPQSEGRSFWALLLDQFSDFMILVLLAAALISGVVGDLVDTLVILTIVVLNAAIGLVQAWRADQALAALQRMAASQATVVRGGQVQQVAAHALVPGDIVLLEAGNKVPADLRLLQIAQLKVDESALTGESVTVDKQAQVLTGTEHSVGDRLNMAFKGTTATHGRGRGLVVATGMQTELGKVAGLLDQDNNRSTPLQLRLAAFGKRVALAVLGICGIIFVVGVLRGEAPLHMVLMAISLAVAAIPEALPAVVTVLLALGARKMVSFNALIRRLPSVETLGSVTFICSDKTGTLTQNRMQAESLVAGELTDPADAGQVTWVPGTGQPNADHQELLRGAALCNDALPGPDGGWVADPTEIALAEVATGAGLDKLDLDAQWPRVHELPFDASRKRMTTFHRTSDGLVAYTKGAPESVLPQCVARWQAHDGDGAAVPLESAVWLARAETLAAQGLRVLALARRNHTQLPASGDDALALESGLSFIGLVGLMDPPRPEAAAAVRECMDAGITPVMITGDHPATARAIAIRLGIVVDDKAPVITGVELATLDEETLVARAQHVRVYAR